MYTPPPPVRQSAPSPAPGPDGPDTADRTLLIGHDIYRHSRYGQTHPLSIPRVSTVLDLARALGWLPDALYREAPKATREALTRFHDPAYVAALEDAERTGALDPERRARFNLGRLESPLFPEIFSRPAISAGGSLLAARLLAEGAARVIHHPAGGTHHSQPARASGFCFLNDCVLAIQELLARGVSPVAYVDLDAHHGDGVEAAFAGHPRVLTISVHEAGRWPHTGRAEDRAGGSARNLPVPEGFNDNELAALVEGALLPLLTAFRPAALVLQCGADALADDPQSRLALSNGALWAAAGRLVPLAPRVLVTGGGGYNPWSVARAWTGIWGTLRGLPIPERLPPAAEAVLRALTWRHRLGHNPPDPWFTTLRDPPAPGPVRPAVRQVIASALAPPLPGG